MATVNKQAIAAAFGRAAAHYEQHADLQRQSADALLAMLPQRTFTHVLDAGCGPGWMSRHWRERHARVTALDLSPLMLEQARQKDAADHYLAGDIESLPLATATFDLAWSNLAVQWCGNLSTALRELYRVVRPGGMLMTCSCSHHLEADALRNIVTRACGRKRRPARLLFQGFQGPDHPIHPAMPETAYLKCFIAQRAD